MKEIGSSVAPGSFRSHMLASPGKHTQGFKREEARHLRHAQRASLAKLSLTEIREEFGLLTLTPPTKREVELQEAAPFQPSFLLSEVPPPSRHITVLVTRKFGAHRRARTEAIKVAA
ncbi:hypothetical protein LC612_38350 [Nostoc sp. CHAB 5834]|nr:hypothetical protein [Nostoc sp. CHAB 5834]